MSHSESLRWQAYIAKRGPLSVLKRLDSGFALVSMLINRVSGGTAELRDFLMYAEPPAAGADQPVSSAADVLAFFGGKKR